MEVAEVEINVSGVFALAIVILHRDSARVSAETDAGDIRVLVGLDVHRAEGSAHADVISVGVLVVRDVASGEEQAGDGDEEERRSKRVHRILPMTLVEAFAGRHTGSSEGYAVGRQVVPWIRVWRVQYVSLRWPRGTGLSSVDGVTLKRHTPSAGRAVMSRGGWSTGVFRSSAMLAALGLALSMTARAQQPADASQGTPAPGQENVDSAQVSPDAEPPAQVARLSVAQGNVSVEPASVNEFSPAEVNYPLTTGDRVWTDYDSLAELQAGQLTVRMAQTTDLTVTAMTDSLAQPGLGQGSAHLRTYVLAAETTTELDTPNIAVTVLAPGDVRVDV